MERGGRQSQICERRIYGDVESIIFDPFYSGYNVIAIDKAYKYSLVAGQNFGYLWILSREKTIPEDVKAEYLKIAKNYGFAVDDLMWITHDDTFK